VWYASVVWCGVFMVCVRELYVCVVCVRCVECVVCGMYVLCIRGFLLCVCVCVCVCVW